MTRSSIISASVLLSLALLAGRLTGLMRELALASVFGVSPEADVAVLMLTLPDLLVNLLISGGLSAALVPRFSALAPHAAAALFRRTSAAVLVVFGLAGLVLVTWPKAIFFLLAPGVDILPSGGEAGLIAVALALPLTGLAGVGGAYLNAQQRFLVVGCGTLFFNAGVLTALMFAQQSAAPMTLLAFGIAAGAALRWAAQMLILPRLPGRAAAGASVIDSSLVKAFALATAGAALALLPPVIIRAMASTIGTGIIASFNYAQKLVELPITILITSISTVALARLSALHAQGKSTQAAAAALRDTQYALLVGIIVLVIGVWFADPVVQIVFGYGNIDDAALARIAGLTKIALLGIPFVALASMATAALNADRRVDLVFKVTVAALLLLPLFAWPGLVMQSERLLMLAVVACQAVSAICLAWFARLRFFGPDAICSRLTLPHFAAVLLLAAVCVSADWLLGAANPWVRLALAGAGFALAMALPVRRFMKFSIQLP